MNSLTEALGIVLAMGAVILFCRAFPFLFFSKGEQQGAGDGPDSGDRSDAGHKENSKRKAFLNYVEKTVPPAAMTVLAFNALGTSFRDNPRDGLFVLAASLFTAIIHLWKRNFLISIIGGTALYMIIVRFFPL